MLMVGIVQEPPGFQQQACRCGLLLNNKIVRGANRQRVLCSAMELHRELFRGHNVHNYHFAGSSFMVAGHAV